MKVLHTLLKIKLYDFFTQYDSSNYSAYKNIKVVIKKPIIDMIHFILAHTNIKC